MSVTAMPSIAPLFRSASVGRRRPQLMPAHDRLRLWTSRRAAVTRIGMFGLVLLNAAGLGGCHHSASLLDNSNSWRRGTGICIAEAVRSLRRFALICNASMSPAADMPNRCATTLPSCDCRSPCAFWWLRCPHTSRSIPNP
jgi:hypothetical protein